MGKSRGMAPGAFLRKVREERDISLRTVCRILGKNVGYMSKLERDEISPSAAMIKEIAPVYGVEPFEIVAGKTKEEIFREIAGPRKPDDPLIEDLREIASEPHAREHLNELAALAKENPDRLGDAIGILRMILREERRRSHQITIRIREYPKKGNSPAHKLWRVAIPVLDELGRVVDRRRVTYSYELPRAKIAELARRQMIAWQDEGPERTLAGLLSTMLEYYDTVTHGAQPKAQSTAAIDWTAIRLACLWRIDSGTDNLTGLDFFGKTGEQGKRGQGHRRPDGPAAGVLRQARSPQAPGLSGPQVQRDQRKPLPPAPGRDGAMGRGQRANRQKPDPQPA